MGEQNESTEECFSASLPGRQTTNGTDGDDPGGPCETESLEGVDQRRFLVLQVVGDH